jgi:hypothetical protein
VAPALRDPAKSGVYGYLKLIPHEGVSHQGATAGASSSAYGDRRYSGAGLVDYSKPGFAVVYLDGPPAETAGTSLVVTLRSAGAGATLAPANGALAVGGELVVRNAGDVPHVVSIPAASVLRAVAPGDALAVAAREAGELEIFVPGASSAASRVFVAPGPFAVVTDAGRFELLDVEPGPRRLHAWHPRLPPSARAVELPAGRVVRVDIEVGVGLEAQDAADAR